MQDYIDPDSEGAGRGQAPVGAQCFVTAATGKAITVSCTVSKSDTVTEDILTSGIKESVAAYLGEHGSSHRIMSAMHRSVRPSWTRRA